MNRRIFVNPAHGNEPYILGTLIALQVGAQLRKRGDDTTIIAPNIYGKRQEGIMAEHNIESAILDEKLGGLYRPILFSDGNYSKLMDDIIEKRDEAESRIREHLRQEYGTIDLEINAGSRIASEARAYYAFPMLRSQLLEYTIYDPKLSFFDREKLERCLRKMDQVESAFRLIFIPSYHTFSFDEDRQTLPNEIATPPLKPIPERSTADIPENSVYCMLSGTESEIDSTYRTAKTLERSGFSVIVPPWAETDEFRKEEPAVITHENISRVIGRAGWGTIWTCQQADKDFEPIPYTEGDDPEIYFNIRTLNSKLLKEATDAQRKEFENMDGIEFVADRIIEDL